MTLLRMEVAQAKAAGELEQARAALTEMKAAAGGQQRGTVDRPGEGTAEAAGECGEQPQGHGAAERSRRRSSVDTALPCGRGAEAPGLGDSVAAGPRHGEAANPGGGPATTAAGAATTEDPDGDGSEAAAAAAAGKGAENEEGGPCGLELESEALSKDPGDGDMLDAMRGCDAGTDVLRVRGRPLACSPCVAVLPFAGIGGYGRHF
jgi:hypothetical protein